MKEEKQYPSNYSTFDPRTNATYDGDPNGDYVMAEDINQLQEGISRIEKAIGLFASEEATLVDRLKAIADKGIEEIRVPEIRLIRAGVELTDSAHTVENLSAFPLVAFSSYSLSLKPLIQKIGERNTLVYGVIDAAKPLAEIQSAVGQWQAVGATGIYLRNFGEIQTARKEENDILQSIRQVGMTLLIQSNQWTKLFGSNVVEGYNPTAEKLALASDCILLIDEFAYYDRPFFGEEMEVKMAPFLKAKKESGVQLLGNAKVTNQSIFNYSMMYGLLYSLDYFYKGDNLGEVTIEPTRYNFPQYMGEWKTENPTLFDAGDSIERTIRAGKLIVNKDLTIKFQGLSVQINDIEWLSQSVNGNVIKEGTLAPTALSTYDVDRIIKLFNSNATIKIDPKVIDTDESGGILPINIPAKNMKENVIEAINKKNDVDSTENQQVIDASIKSVSAAKVVGDYTTAQMKKNVIAAVNSSEGTINVDKASIGIVSSTEINSNLISSEQATINRANITETVTALNVDVSNLLTANKATIDYLTSLRIETEVLITDTLEVSDLKADNISAIVIEAVKAEITSGVFRDIVTEYLTADIIKTELINAVNSMIGEAVIDGAMIEEATITSAHITDLTANKITAGTLNVGVVTITGPEGHLLIKENKLVIYDKADSEGIRRKRVQLGDVSDVLGTDTYGLIVMGEDGSTVLYDHTGVYNEGIHDNAVNNDKLEDEAVDSRVIRAGSVIAKHIQGETITGDKIAANAITTNKIAAGTITAGSAIISDAAIGSAKISELHGNKIIAGTITAEQIAANSITVDKLSVGDRVNLIKNGFDSFEQFPVGHQIGEALTGAESSIVSEDMAYSGNKSLLIAGNNVKNTLLLYNKENKDRLTSLKKDQDYILSSYCMVEDSSVQVEIGIRYYENEEVINDVWSPSFIAKPGEMVRAFYKFQPTAENVDCAVMLRTNASNVNVYFDAIQIEAVESDITKPSWWVSTETTDIDGGSIKTGTIDASRIKIGQGTQFGNGDIITLSDEGISVQATNGEAHINSDGIKIVGGAFLLENEDKVIIDGQNGIAVQSPTNKISMDPDTGFAIMKRLNDEKVFYVDPDGNLFLKGRVEVTSSDSIYSKDEVDDVINQIELTPGEDGKTSHLHTAYSWSSDGTDRFTTVYPGENFLLDSQRERVGKTSEFLRVSEWDLTPVFDEYGIEKEYALSFDLKSEVAGPIVVYCQSGANTEYEIGQTIVQATTEYQRFSIKITPKHSNPEFQVSQLAFYGTYNSGRIPSVKNAKLEIGNASTVYTTNAEESFDDAYPIFSGSYTDYLETNSTKPSDYVWKRILGDGGKDGIAGNDGRGIQSTTINYAQGTSATTPPTSGWSTSVPPLVKGQYLWTQTIWMYTDGSSELGYSVSYNAKDGNTGKDGIAGKDGVGISSTLIEYASATTGTTAPTTGWQSTVPTVGEGSYLWTKTTWTYTDNTTEVGYSVAKMGVSGQDGKDGVAGKDGLGIKATTIEYAQAVSGTTPPSTGWTLEVPSLTKGQYLWTQTTWTYTDNSSETGYSVSYNAKDGNSGKDGIAGKDGVGIKTTLVQYVGSTSGTTAPTTGWATTVPTVPEGSFLWTKTTWTYTDNTTEVGYSVAKMGVSGQDGKDGIPGKDGLGIKNTLIEYAQSTSGTVSPTTGWSEQVPTLVKGQYLWTQTTWTYTDNSTEKGYSVSYNAKDGNTGSDGKPGKDGNGIVKTDIQYVGSATGTTPPTSGWTAAIPTVPEGSYLWTKTTWTYTDGTTEVGYSVAKM
ncbi:hypothetical protein I4L69_001942, partial [Enterococcus faecium]|nr:hypothetical protein [Enterococcus faecium]